MSDESLESWDDTRCPPFHLLPQTIMWLLSSWWNHTGLHHVFDVWNNNKKTLTGTSHFTFKSHVLSHCSLRIFDLYYSFFVTLSPTSCLFGIHGYKIQPFTFLWRVQPRLNSYSNKHLMSSLHACILHLIWLIFNNKLTSLFFLQPLLVVSFDAYHPF